MSGTMAVLLSDAARRFGNRGVLLFPGNGSHGFEELEAMAAGVAAGLAAQGVGPGDRVLLHLPNCVEWVVGYHAIARLGGVVVPVNIMATADELAFIAEDAQIAAALVAADKAHALAGLFGVRVMPCTPGARDDAWRELAGHSSLAPADVAPDDLFSICYTSGTTGRPKGAMLTHGNVFQSVAGTAMIHARQSGDVALSALPFPHVYGNAVLNAGLLTGMRLIAPARFEPGEALAMIAEHGVTLFEGVPTMYYQMLAHPALAGADLSSLTRCTVGGQTMPLPKLEAVAARFGCPVLELWGMTELAGPATSHSPAWPPRLGSVGKTFPGMQIRIVATDDPGRALPMDEDGEVLVRGPLVTRGYWRRPEASAEVIDAEGWLATGDVGHLDAEGYLTIADRKKDMILTAGFNVYPAEIERVLALHPAVCMAVVIGVPDEEKGEVGHAHLVIDGTAEVDEAAIFAHCRAHLSAYKVPRRIVFVDDLPRTSSGKLMRNILREQYIQNQIYGENHD